MKCHRLNTFGRLGILGSALLLMPSIAAAQTKFKAPESEPEPQPAFTPPKGEDASSAAPEQEDGAESELLANTDPESGPPADLLDTEAPASDGRGGYVRKDDSPYVDVFGAWGWSNNSYLVTICPLNMHLGSPTSVLGFHGRFLAFGVMSFEQHNIAEDGTTSDERRTTFVLELFNPGLRAYFAGPFFWAFNVPFGMAFYDALVPTLDLQSGLGFDYDGWGLEAGLRSSRVPRGQVIVNSEKFLRDEYGLLVYLALETNIHF